MAGPDFAAHRQPGDYPASLLAETHWRMPSGIVMQVVGEPYKDFSGGQKRTVVNLRCLGCGGLRVRRLGTLVKLRAICRACEPAADESDIDDTA